MKIAQGRRVRRDERRASRTRYWKSFGATLARLSKAFEGMFEVLPEPLPDGTQAVEIAQYYRDLMAMIEVDSTNPFVIGPDGGFGS